VDLLRAFKARWARLAAERRVRPASTVGASVETQLDSQEWRSGDIAWLAGLDGVTAAVVVSATSKRVRLAMGSTPWAYQVGFSPSDPSLCHNRREALRRMREWRSRIVAVREHDELWAERGSHVEP